MSILSVELSFWHISLSFSLSFSLDNLLSQTFSSIFLSDALIFCPLTMIRISVRPLSIDRTKSEARRETVFKKPCASRVSYIVARDRKDRLSIVIALGRKTSPSGLRSDSELRSWYHPGSQGSFALHRYKK